MKVETLWHQSRTTIKREIILFFIIATSDSLITSGLLARGSASDFTWRVMHRVVSILSRLQKNFLEKARDLPRVASRYENSWHPIFGPWLVGRSFLFFSREPPWGLHSDRVATGFSISAYIDAHQQTRTRTRYHHPRARRYSSHPYHIFLHIMPLFSEPHLSAEGRKIETKSLENERMNAIGRWRKDSVSVLKYNRDF